MIRRTMQWILGAFLIWTVCATLSERNALATIKVLNSPYGANDAVEVFIGDCTTAPCQIVVYKRLSDNACQFTVVGNGLGLTQDIQVYGSTVTDVIVIAANFIDTGCGYSVGNLSLNGWNVIVHGGAGDDFLWSFLPISAAIYGDAGNDQLQTPGTGILDGGYGNDGFATAGTFTNAVIRGGAGNDCIEDYSGSAGSVDCGTGTDTLVPTSGGAVPASLNCERISTSC